MVLRPKILQITKDIPSITKVRGLKRTIINLIKGILNRANLSIDFSVIRLGITSVKTFKNMTKNIINMNIDIYSAICNKLLSLLSNEYIGFNIHKSKSPDFIKQITISITQKILATEKEALILLGADIIFKRLLYLALFSAKLFTLLSLTSTIANSKAEYTALTIIDNANITTYNRLTSLSIKYSFTQKIPILPKDKILHKQYIT